MDFNTLSQIFETYGWPGIICFVLFFGCMYFINYKENTTNKYIGDGFKTMTDSMKDQNKELVHTIIESHKDTQNKLFSLVNKSLNSHDNDLKDTHNQSMKQRFEISEYIEKYLWDLMNMYSAQRTMVIEFHNSKENMNGLSFMWYDVQYEKQQRDVTAISNISRNLQASILLPVINKVNSAEGNIVIYGPEDIENLYEESTVLYSIFKEAKLTHIIFCGLYNETNDLIGFLVIDYSDKHKFHEDLINFYDIKSVAAAISQLLQFK